jgi:hypothetical protein
MDFCLHTHHASSTLGTKLAPYVKKNDSVLTAGITVTQYHRHCVTKTLFLQGEQKHFTQLSLSFTHASACFPQITLTSTIFYFSEHAECMVKKDKLSERSEYCENW